MPDTLFAADSWAVLFDMDGVLVVNTPFHIDAWLQFSRRHGHPITEAQYLEHINGRVSADAMAYVLGRVLLPDELATLTEEKEGIYRDLYHPYLRPTPGLLPFLSALQAAGVKRAVGTSAPVSNVFFTLDGLNIRSCFDAVVDASMIRHGKPDPEIYLTAARHVNVVPARCVVFEDAFAGIEAGLRAGMAVVALATTHTREELSGTGAALIIDDFGGLTVDAVRALIS